MRGTDGANTAMRTPAWARALTLAGLLVLGAWMARPGWAQNSGKDTIAEVTVEGNRRIAAQRVLNNIDSQPGKEYSHAVLMEDVARIGNEPAFRKAQFIDRALEPILNTPEEFARFLVEDRATSGRVVKEAGLTPQ